MELFLGDGAVIRNKRPARVNVATDLSRTAVSVVAADIAKSVGAAAPLHLAMSDQCRFESDNYSWDFRVCDAIDFLRACGSKLGPEVFIYLDPPYLLSQRYSQRPLYEFEFSSDQQHEMLLELATNLRCRIMISGYWSELYGSRLSDWCTYTFQLQTRGGRVATEYLWMNYERPVVLHDYRFLGKNFRERERIKRKAGRWVAGLQRLPVLEQQAILSAMQDAGLIADT